MSIKIISRMVSKKHTQQMIKALRAEGLTVEKINSGYQCKVNDKLIFKAMIGANGYLVRYAEQLFI